MSDVLIFVEDPGAANMVADVPRLLADRGHTVHLATGGFATAYLGQRGVSVSPLRPDEDLDRLVTSVAPRMIVVGTAENPDSAGLKLIALAAARRMPSVGIVDSSTHLAFRFRGRSDHPLEFCPDHLIVPDAASRNGLIALGLGEERIIVAGHPHWDHVRSVGRALDQRDRAELRRRHFKLSSNRTAILFAAELSGGIDPSQFDDTAGYTLTGSSGKRGRTEIVIDEFLAALAPRRAELHLVLRLHPKQAGGELSDYRAHFDTVSQAEPSLEVIHAADAVVGMTSMLMVEATLMQRPTLAILPRVQEAAWLPTLQAGLTPYACDRESVRAGIMRLLDAPELPDPRALEESFPPGALDRIVAALEDILKR